MELALAVKALQRALERGANEAMRPLGLTAAQADALTVLRQAGPLSLERARRSVIKKQGIPAGWLTGSWKRASWSGGRPKTTGGASCCR